MFIEITFLIWPKIDPSAIVKAAAYPLAREL
jgi:hypothetical protein